MTSTSKRRADLESTSPVFESVANLLDGLTAEELHAAKRICDGRLAALQEKSYLERALERAGLTDLTGVVTHVVASAWQPGAPSFSVTAHIGALRVEVQLRTKRTLGAEAAASGRIDFTHLYDDSPPGGLLRLSAELADDSVHGGSRVIRGYPGRDGAPALSWLLPRLQYTSGLGPATFVDNPELRRLPALAAYTDEQPPECALLLAVVCALVEAHLPYDKPEERAAACAVLRDLVVDNDTFPYRLCVAGAPPPGARVRTAPKSTPPAPYLGRLRPGPWLGRAPPLHL